MSKSQQRFVVGVLLALAGLVSAALLIEGTLRLLTPEWLRFRMSEMDSGQQVFFNSDEGWPLECLDGGCYRFTPGSEFKVVTSEYSHSVSIDEYGARVTPDSIISDARFIPFVGDSFTFGIGVDDNETFVNLLDVVPNVDLLNMGIPGSALSHHIDIVERRHAELGAPELYVFVFFLGNDFQNLVEGRNIREIESVESETNSSESLYPTLSSQLDWLSSMNEYVLSNYTLRRIYTIQWVRHKLLLLFNQANADLMDPVFLITRTDRPYLEDAMEYFDEELQRLIATARVLQFEFAFLVLPDRHQVNSELLEVKLSYYGISEDKIDTMLPNRAIIDVLNVNDITYLDITECISVRNDVKDLYYLRDNHFTSRGHAAAAACMSKEMEQIFAMKLSGAH